MDMLRSLYRKEIKPDINHFFLLFSVFIFSLLRIPSLVEPDWYGDEGIYQVVGRALNQGRLLYSEIWDNKPPVLYSYYALVNGNLFLIRLLSLLFGLGAVVAFYLLAKVLFQGKRLPIFISTTVFSILFGLPLLEGNIANAENFILFPVLVSLLLITKLKAKSNLIIPITSGFLLSIAFLTKIIALFDLAAFLVILFALRFYNEPLVDVKNHALSKPLEFLQVVKQESILVISFLAPIVFTTLFFFIRGGFSDFLKATFSQNVGYVGYANMLTLNIGSVHLSIPQGLLILKLFFLVLGVFLIIRFRNKFGVSGIVIYTWIIFSLFNTFFSGRPYTHYVLALLSSFCLLLGFIFYKKRFALIHTASVIFILILLALNFYFYTKIIPYYQNYWSFVMDHKSVSDYQAFFDKNTPRDYELARFIEINTDKRDKVFILSDSGQIYFLSDKLPPGRYIVEYHINSYKNGIEETKKAIDMIKPKFIISTKDALLKNFIDRYIKKYLIDKVIIYERQF